MNQTFKTHNRLEDENAFSVIDTALIKVNQNLEFKNELNSLEIIKLHNQINYMTSKLKKKDFTIHKLKQKIRMAKKNMKFIRNSNKLLIVFNN